jgi:hypothetical protein
MGVIDRKEREKVEKKRQILDAARSLFLEQGFEKTSIRNIAEVIAKNYVIDTQKRRVNHEEF